MNLIRQVLVWLHVLALLAGVVLCALYSSRSRWSWLLLGGFALELLATSSYALIPILIGRGVMSYSGGVEAVFVVLSLLSLTSSVAIVAGAVALLAAGDRSAGPA